MKAEVTQHAVRIIDAVDALQGQNERSCQLRTMAAFFILIAKFHNCSHIRVCLNNLILKLLFLYIKMEEFSCYSLYSTETFQLNTSEAFFFLNFKTKTRKF